MNIPVGLLSMHANFNEKNRVKQVSFFYDSDLTCAYQLYNIVLYVFKSLLFMIRENFYFLGTR